MTQNKYISGTLAHSMRLAVEISQRESYIWLPVETVLDEMHNWNHWNGFGRFSILCFLCFLVHFWLFFETNTIGIDNIPIERRWLWYYFLTKDRLHSLIPFSCCRAVFAARPFSSANVKWYPNNIIFHTTKHIHICILKLMKGTSNSIQELEINDNKFTRFINFFGFEYTKHYSGIIFTKYSQNSY